jgi:hypothetical protein
MIIWSAGTHTGCTQLATHIQGHSTTWYSMTIAL